MGATIGGIVAPAFVPIAAVMWGWRATFIAGGATGFIWLAVWMLVYRQPSQHPSVSKEELDYINADREEIVEQKVSWLSVLKYRETWAFVVGKLLTDPVWWFYLFWLPKWLNESRHIDIGNMGMPLIAIYTMASVGSVAGGWLSSRLMARTNKPNFARKVTMLICALCVVPIATLSYFQSLWFAVFAVGLAAAAHQGWSANLVTTVGDVFPKRLVGTVVGIGGVAGMVGSFFFSGVIGETLQRTGQYWALFTVGASAYLVALGIMHLLMPRMTVVKLRD
jgi:ACS family hexuronate transporter-like MFS transporter